MKILTLSIITILTISLIDTAYSQELDVEELPDVEGYQEPISKAPEKNSTPEQNNINTRLPDWIRTVAGLWASGLITDAEYLRTLEYVINNGLITVNISGTPTANSITTVPDRPTNLSAENVDNGESNRNRVVFTWDAPINDGGSPITSYILEWLRFGDTNWKKSIGDEIPGHAFSSPKDTTYGYRVSAVNSEGISEPSSIIRHVTLPKDSTVPDPPTNFKATAGNNQVILTWDAPINDGGSPITGYKVERALSASAWLQESSVGTNTSITITGLTNGEEYTFRVYAVNKIGDGKPSVITVTPVTPKTTVPDPPKILPIRISEGKLVITWAPPTNDGGSPILDYIIQRYSDGEWLVVKDKDPLAFLIYHYNNPVPGTTYLFRVLAENSNGASDPSDTVRIHIDATTTTIPEGTTPLRVFETPNDYRVSDIKCFSYLGRLGVVGVFEYDGSSTVLLRAYGYDRSGEFLDTFSVWIQPNDLENGDKVYFEQISKERHSGLASCRVTD